MHTTSSELEPYILELTMMTFCLSLVLFAFLLTNTVQTRTRTPLIYQFTVFANSSVER